MEFTASDLDLAPHAFPKAWNHARSASDMIFLNNHQRTLRHTVSTLARAPGRENSSEAAGMFDRGWNYLELASGTTFRLGIGARLKRTAVEVIRQPGKWQRAGKGQRDKFAVGERTRFN